jgi:alkylation response protein AidB-like acyl-CoA dehydrogenase
VDVTETPQEQRFRADVRSWLEENKPAEPLPSRYTLEGFRANLEWERKIGEKGWLLPALPVDYGGAGFTLWAWLIFEEEYYGAGLPRPVSSSGPSLLAPSLLDFGTDEQKQKYLPRMARAEDIWCQGWSEPEAGSDLAGVKTRAVRDDERGGWRLYGQKIWTSNASRSTHIFGLVRTDPEAPRHQGLTYFMLALSEPGVAVRPIAEFGGEESFAEVFFDGAFVPDADIIGGVNDGWKVAMGTTGSERALQISPGSFFPTTQRLIELYRERKAETSAHLREEVLDAWMAVEAFRWYTAMAASRIVAGEKLGAESSLSKVFYSEADAAIHKAALRLLDGDAYLEEPWTIGYEAALGGLIYAGTNEIQRNIIAERVLGLPRTPRA